MPTPPPCASNYSWLFLAGVTNAIKNDFTLVKCAVFLTKVYATSIYWTFALQWKTECDFIINVHNADINFEIYVHKRIHSTYVVTIEVLHTCLKPRLKHR